MFAGDNPNDGLAQLDGLTYKRHLEPATVRLLVDTALDLPAGDSTRVAIWELLEAAEKRQSGGKKPE
jgi:hypothetical protein